MHSIAQRIALGYRPGAPTPEAEAIDGAPTNIQKIIVTVSYEGREMRVLEGVKTDR